VTVELRSIGTLGGGDGHLALADLLKQPETKDSPLGTHPDICPSHTAGMNRRIH